MIHRGSVTAFDGPVGLGTITAVDGSTFPFHCVSIADGTRTIEVGTNVRFSELLKLGQIEAAHIEPA